MTDKEWWAEARLNVMVRRTLFEKVTFDSDRGFSCVKHWDKNIAERGKVSEKSMEW